MAHSITKSLLKSLTLDLLRRLVKKTPSWQRKWCKFRITKCDAGPKSVTASAGNDDVESGQLRHNLAEKEEGLRESYGKDSKITVVFQFIWLVSSSWNYSYYLFGFKCRNYVTYAECAFFCRNSTMFRRTTTLRWSAWTAARRTIEASTRGRCPPPPCNILPLCLPRLGTFPNLRICFTFYLNVRGYLFTIWLNPWFWLRTAFERKKGLL